MMNRDELKKQISEVLKQAMEQLDDVKAAVAKSRDRLEADFDKLMRERDRLLKTIGEQTTKLANQGKLPMPEIVKQNIERLNDVIESMVSAKPKRAKKKRVKKTATKSTKKKSTKKVAKTTKKK